MSDEKLDLDSLLVDTTKENLEKVGLMNAIRLNGERIQQEINHESEIHSLKQENEKLQVQHTTLANKILDMQLMLAREAMRPHRLYHASVGFDPHEGKYYCRITDMDEDLEGNQIVAYGDTPQNACDAFDAVWTGRV